MINTCNMQFIDDVILSLCFQESKRDWMKILLFVMLVKDYSLESIQQQQIQLLWTEWIVSSYGFTEVYEILIFYGWVNQAKKSTMLPN